MNLQQILIDAKEFGFFKSPVKVVEIDSLVNPELLVWILIFLHKKSVLDNLVAFNFLHFGFFEEVKEEEYLLLP